MESFDQRNNSGVFGSSAAVPRPPSNNSRLNAFNQMGAGGSENPKPGIGIPPSHPSTNLPYSQYIASQNQHHLGSQRLRSPNLSPGSSSSSSHSRSMSQPSFFSLDSLPPLSPLTYRDPAASPVPAATSFGDSVAMDVSMEENLGSTHTAPSLTANRGHSLPPRKGHRRSNSDSPLGISGLVQSYSQSVPTKNVSDRDNLVSKGENTGFEKPIQLVLKEPNKDMVHFDCFTGEAMGKKEDCIDDLFNAYMNLDNIQNMNFPGMEDKDLDSRTSGSKTVESSDNEVESHANGKTTSAQGATSSYKEERKEGIKRGSSGDIAPVGRHRRSFSLDSSIGDFQLEDESSKLPPLQNRFGQHSPSNSIDGKTSDTSIEFVKREFSSDELKKIMESDKLTEIAMADPKRAKRILANRVSAARSKERKTRYISELEHKVQTLQAETTSLSTQFTKLQMDNSELKSLNNEYKLKLQALEQQSQLKDALNETLDAEVRRLRRTVANLGGDPLL